MWQTLEILYYLRDLLLPLVRVLRMKRVRADEDAGPLNTKKTRSDPETHITEAAKFNEMVLRKLQKAYVADPEDNLLAKFPSEYSTRLASRKKQDEGTHTSYTLSTIPVTKAEMKGASSTDNSKAAVEQIRTARETSVMDNVIGDNRGVLLEQDSKIKTRTIAAGLGLSSASTAAVVFPLAEAVQRLLRAEPQEMSADSSSLWAKLYQTIDASEVIWQNEIGGGVAVFHCGSGVALKMIPNFEDFTEYTALQYLRRYAPQIPVPEPMGAISSEKTAYIFMSFIAGPTLESVWSRLPKEQKVSLSNDLSGVLLELRALQLPKDGLLGGVGGEGCKDSRRRSRISQKPIRSIADFEDFVFSNPHFGGSVYIKLLRSMSQSQASKIVFSHADLRPANIVVLPDQQGDYRIAGILDWEMSGFYPDYWESVKATNTMAPQEEDDWYLHLPACASPTSYPLHWLVDRKWDVHVA